MAQSNRISVSGIDTEKMLVSRMNELLVLVFSCHFLTLRKIKNNIVLYSCHAHFNLITQVLLHRNIWFKLMLLGLKNESIV